MEHSLTKNLKVLVCQRGARHRYAIPRLFEDAGLLAAFYTDSCVHSHVGRLASSFTALGLKEPTIQALASRVPERLPKKKVFSSDRPLLGSLSREFISSDMSSVYKRWGLQGADVVYSMYGEEFSFLQWVKRQGAKIIVDVFVHPGTTRIVAQESNRVMGRVGINSIAIKDQDNHSKRTFELADILLCPSLWVADGVRNMFPACGHKIRIVPYGSSLERNKSINEAPSVGRILFAGREPLRKGLHHLAEASVLLRKAGIEVEIRAAGVDAHDVEWIEHRDQLNCLGTLPLDRMHKEFEQADLFVLPSLSEGQAGVVLEAMAFGCPVVATRESGVDFESGCGVSVPVGNPPALAKAITEIIKNRERRNQLAKGALSQSKIFSQEAWKKRLVLVVEEACKL